MASSAITIGVATGASQSDQETGTSTTTVVTPGRQQFHPSAAKAWLRCDTAGTISLSYNITSITDTGTGAVTVTLATDFSTANYTAVATPEAGSALMCGTSTMDVGSFIVYCYSYLNAVADPNSYSIAAFGDQ